MRFPAFTKLRYSTSFSTNSSGWAITRWSPNKPAAAAFMAFMHTPAVLTDWYAKTYSFPADNRWSGAQANSDPLQKQMLAWIRQNNALYTTDFIPVDLDLNGNFPVFQGIIGNKMTVQQAANLYESVITHWRAENPQEVQFIKEWIGSNP
jgi:maltose-binding protein MalE